MCNLSLPDLLHRQKELVSGLSSLRQIKTNSIDLRLGPLLRVPGPRYGDWVEVDLTRETHYLLPKEFVLASTIEQVHIPLDLKGQLSGKSTNARWGLIVEEAGLFESGFRGQATLELFNMNPRWSFPLVAGMSICQMEWSTVSTPLTRDTAYGSAVADSHYQGQQGPTPPWGQLGVLTTLQDQ